jgi:hypothetical protein
MRKLTNVSIGDCTPAQLKTLLGLGGEAQGTRNELLLLAARPAGMRQILRAICAPDSEGIDVALNMVCSPDTEPGALTDLKNRAKDLLGRVTGEEERAAATILYHAAIAAAFAHHGDEISSFPIDTRWVLYQDLADALAGDPLAGVFRTCTDRIEEERAQGMDAGAGE